MVEAAWKLEPLARHHDREAFTCSVVPLDGYLKKYARQNADLDYGRTFVLLKEADARVYGYCFHELRNDSLTSSSR